MSDKDMTSVNRRDVLQKAATASIAGLGVGAVSGNVASKEKGKLSRLKSEGVILTQRKVSASSSEKLPSAETRTGKRLLSNLVADGLLQRATLDVLPDSESADGQIHRVRTDGSKEISFTTSTPQGRLQVIFGEDSVPSAALFPEDSDGVVMYTAPDGENYERSELDLTVSESSDDVTATSCDSTCGGCDCVDNWCVDGVVPKSNKTACATCNDGECVITNSCGC